jgi:hypothetical protein
MSLTPEIEDIHRQACLQVRGVTWRGITVVWQFVSSSFHISISELQEGTRSQSFEVIPWCSS